MGERFFVDRRDREASASRIKLIDSAAHLPCLSSFSVHLEKRRKRENRKDREKRRGTGGFSLQNQVHRFSVALATGFSSEALGDFFIKLFSPAVNQPQNQGALPSAWLRPGFKDEATTAAKLLLVMVRIAPPVVEIPLGVCVFTHNPLVTCLGAASVGAGNVG